MNSRRRFAASSAWLIVTVLAFIATGRSTSNADDSAARSNIFAEQHASDSALSLHRRFTGLPAEQQFEVLARWVLPGTEHDAFRLQVDFEPTQPAPFSPAGGKAKSAESQPTGRRVQSGGVAVSPALDLLDAAIESGRLDDLMQRVTACPPNGRARADRAAFLTLMHLARQDTDSAIMALEECATARTAVDPASGPVDWEWLLMSRPELIKPVGEHVAGLLGVHMPWLSETWTREMPRHHFAAVLERLQPVRPAIEAEPETLQSVATMTQWAPVSRTTAATRGVGEPCAEWQWRPGSVSNTVSHGFDYLYFNTPLRGSYDVECDVSPFYWRDAHLIVAARWAAALSNHAEVAVGSFHRTLAQHAIDPPLTRSVDWNHYRVAVRDGTATTFINGRAIRTEQLTPDHDPWLAIRSSPRHDGSVRNLRITGSPTIPVELRLNPDPDCGQWLSYYENFEKSVGRPFWALEARPDATPQLVGLHRPVDFVTDGPLGVQESLLRYHRPMLEDGTIEYEFFYEPGQCDSHPALDRLVFFLQPEGVRFHWLTDGSLDRSELTRDNVFDEPASWRGDGPLSLKPGEWNRLQLSLTGDRVSLTLNELLVCERDLEATNQRTFGLFHFSDRSTLRVRNAVWRGDWPKSLPPLAEQELFQEEADFLDRNNEKLTESFEHDFMRDGLPSEKFTVVFGEPGKQIVPTKDGVVATCRAQRTFQEATLSPAVRIEGDFDISARYSEFSAHPVVRGHGTIAMIVRLGDNERNEAGVMQRKVNRRDEFFEHVSDCSHYQRVDGTQRKDVFGSFPMEQSGGTLRLVRRGETVYYLTAENDSSNFRLRSSRKVGSGPVPLNGLRLMAQSHQVSGDVRVVWQSLSVRAEKLAGRALGPDRSVLARLNRERDKLPVKLAFDFRKTGPLPPDFQTWNSLDRWSPDDGGLSMRTVGAKVWLTTGIGLNNRIDGDFDFTADFKVRQFEKPTGSNRATIHLSARLPDVIREQLSIIYTIDSAGQHDVIIESREPKRGGGYMFRPMEIVSLKDVTRMRIARRGNLMTVLVATAKHPDERVITSTECSPVPLSRGALNFSVHAGDEGQTAHVLLHSLTISAAKVSGSAIPPGPGQPAAPESLLDQALRLFRE